MHGGSTPYAVSGTVRRGFTEAVALRCAEFCDRPAAGYGVLRPPGLAAVLFRHPVRRVTLLDRSPDEMFESPQFGLWHRAVVPDELDEAPSMIPAALFDLLPPSLPSEYPGEEWVGGSFDAAVTALNAACLEYGRRAFAKKGGR